jgi:DNA-directed RNA polymerase II subunit RPB1
LDLVYDYFEIETVNTENMSPWVLRIVLQRSALIDTRITMEEIADKINIYNEVMHLIFSNDNADKLVLRFRLIR